MENQKFAIACVFSAALVACCIAWAISWGYVHSWRAVTENGYVQQQMQGSQATIWIKPDKTAPK